MPGTAGTDRRGLVAVARVAKAHGIRGELCMDSHADSPLLFAAGATLYLAPPAGKGQARPRPYVIRSARDNNGRFILALEGVADRNAAEALRGAEVLIPEADLPPPDEGEEYLHKLLGAHVFLADDTEVGVFTAILDTPGQLTWVMTAKGGAEILFPAVPEFILGLDAEAGRIHIDPPPGLLELYLGAPGDAADDIMDDGAGDGAAGATVDTSAGGNAKPKRRPGGGPGGRRPGKKRGRGAGK
jgi:16S rRNA processing protein RimM